MKRKTKKDQAGTIEPDILDNALVMITVLDRKGTILAWNRAAETVTGYAREEVIGSAAVWKQLYPDKEYRRTITEKIVQILSSKNYFADFQTTIRTKSGDRRIVSWNTRETGSGAGAREIAIGLDITEQRKAEAFRESVVENANVLITVLDSAGGVLVWNEAAETITGYTRDEVIGSSDVWKRLYPDKEYRRTITKRITDIIAARHYFENLETTIVTKSGEKKIISWNTRQIGADETHQSIAIGRDITEQRKAEEALIAYVTEMAMRIKQPVEIIGDNLRDVAQLLRQGKLTPDEMAVILEGQVRNATQIVSNIKEFQKAIIEKQKEIPEAYRKFLKG
ncbi:MAG: RNase II stability modulator [Methanoregula sp. PtaU1.Bin051]|nr:MAG: RNase II stability modulator [Methanoregula sp. PtaU1.Bin051]